jgi:hypothetical protein
MTAADDEANRRHLNALVGGLGTRWREDIERQNVKVLGIPWFELPLFHERDRRHLSIRRLWWRETDYNRKPPSEEFLAQLPQLLAAAKLELEADKREIAAELAAGRELLRQARRPPCEDCLRPESRCRVRCLRSMGVTDRPEPETVRRNPYVDLANAPPWLRTILHEHFPDPSKVLIEELEEKLAMLRRRAVDEPKP